jgi:hypothetical protein
MRKFLVCLCATLVAVMLHAPRAHAQCYHCAYDSDGGAFCHPISSSGYKACSRLI